MGHLYSGHPATTRRGQQKAKTRIYGTLLWLLWRNVSRAIVQWALSQGSNPLPPAAASPKLKQMNENTRTLKGSLGKQINKLAVRLSKEETSATDEE